MPTGGGSQSTTGETNGVRPRYCGGKVPGCAGTGPGAGVRDVVIGCSGGRRGMDGICRRVADLFMIARFAGGSVHS
jgi:hypothetical protein